MSYTQAIISGIVQGITEFLPISSSGHLVMLHSYLGLKEPQLFFDIFLHIGTLFAVVVYFRRDIIKLLTTQKRLLLYIIIGTVPTAFIGYFFNNIAESLFVNVKMTGAMLLITALLLFAADWTGGSKFYKDRPKSISRIKAFTIGIVQGLAIIPGISRSGSTISAAMLLNAGRMQAIRFSFLLSIPAIIGASLLKVVSAEGAAAITMPMVSGAIFAFAFGLASIYILVKSVINRRLKFFGFYCLLAGGAIIVL